MTSIMIQTSESHYKVQSLITNLRVSLQIQSLITNIRVSLQTLRVSLQTFSESHYKQLESHYKQLESHYKQLSLITNNFVEGRAKKCSSTISHSEIISDIIWN